MHCKSLSRHTAPLTAQSPGMQCLYQFESQVPDSSYWVKHSCYNSQPLSYSYHILWWLGRCAHQTVCLHCCSNLDMPSGSMYHAFLNNYAHKSSIWLVSEKDIDLWFSLPAVPPTWTTIFPDPERMLQLQNKSGVHIWPLWFLTFSFSALDLTLLWTEKYHWHLENIFCCRNNLLPY